MSDIVYACALVGIILFARIAERTNPRGLPLVAACTVAMVGYIILLLVTNYKTHLAATFILAFGIFCTIPNSTT